VTNRRGSATTRSVSAQTPDQLEQAQEHIRPLIGLIDRLNEANAEDELDYQQTTRGCALGCSHSPAIK